jgi:hypothetical protein
MPNLKGRAPAGSSGVRLRTVGHSALPNPGRDRNHGAGGGITSLVRTSTIDS